MSLVWAGNMNNNRDEDWIKTLSWDVRNPGDCSLVTTLDQLCFKHQTVEKVMHWVTLPAWEAAPESLKAEAEKFLSDQEKLVSGNS